MSISIKKENVLEGNISWMADNTTPAFKRGSVPVAYLPKYCLSEIESLGFSYHPNGDGCYIMADISECPSEKEAEQEVQRVKGQIEDKYLNQFYFTDLSGNL